MSRIKQPTIPDLKLEIISHAECAVDLIGTLDDPIDALGSAEVVNELTKALCKARRMHSTACGDPLPRVGE